MTEAKRETKCNMDYKIFLILSLILLTPLISATSFGYNYLDNQPSGNITNEYIDNTYINQTLELNSTQFETGEPATIKTSWLTSFIESISKWANYYTITEIDNRYSNNTGDQNLSTYVQGNMSSETTTTYTPTNGSALSFDGVNDYVDIENSTFTTGWGEMAMSAWIYIDSWVDHSGIVFARGSGVNGLALRSLAESNMIFYVNIGGTNYYTRSSASSLSSGGWHHVVGTWKSGEQIYVYIDGANVSSETNGVATGTNTQQEYYKIGLDTYTGGGANRHFNGKIDEIQIFNRSLNSTEVEQIYNSGVGLYANTSIAPFNEGLVSGWHFDEGSGTTAIDVTGRNNGTLVNGPSWVSGKVPHYIATQVLGAIGLMPWVSATNFISTDFSLQWIGNTLKNPWNTISILGNSTNRWNVHLNNVTMNGTQGWSGNCVNSSILNGIIVGCND